MFFFKFLLYCINVLQLLLLASTYWGRTVRYSSTLVSSVQYLIHMALNYRPFKFRFPDGERKRTGRQKMTDGRQRQLRRKIRSDYNAPMRDYRLHANINYYSASRRPPARPPCMPTPLYRWHLVRTTLLIPGCLLPWQRIRRRRRQDIDFR